MAQDIRPSIALECTVCKAHNYQTTKNRRTQQERLELKKFCHRKCKTHTPHREAK